ncbi:MAG: hypothetical protein LBE12_19780 [Planctomycetaceae bacterium]|nr:hypothetical protein [Planctomycetaceae bacterium]
MSQADYYQNGNNSACGTINYSLLTIHYSMFAPKFLNNQTLFNVPKCPYQT